MIYTLDNLISIFSRPIQRDRWGKDTRKVAAIVSIIQAADCSSCMFRRKVSELSEILQKYGDDIAKSPKTVIKSPENTRIPCPDCVDKHLCQSFVLQNEFYQGYADNLPLIRGHLLEAYEECPNENSALKSVISGCIRDLETSGTPNVPILLADSLNTDKNAVYNEEISFNPPETGFLRTLTQNLTKDMADRLIELLEPLKPLKSVPETLFRAEWKGRLALSADFVAKTCQSLSKHIRSRRLLLINHLTEEDALYRYAMCEDILAILQ